ncbi:MULTISPECIES: hypothetical protein [Thermococcus]|uniref:hypothetical protein n=1 Tax=Thermococcus TaxID=2263 RepID=UPI00143C7015|nr:MULTISPECIES: hypothetical protein [Thermococcus]MBP1911494.1 hypothetical protein [Thermococcus stetteri]NJD98686.1 hypothetical protein [Thermococcus sp. LS1]
MNLTLTGNVISALMFPLLLYYAISAVKSREFEKPQTWAVLAALFMSVRGIYSTAVYFNIIQFYLFVDELLNTLAVVSVIPMLLTVRRKGMTNKSEGETFRDYNQSDHENKRKLIF